MNAGIWGLGGAGGGVGGGRGVGVGFGGGGMLGGRGTLLNNFPHVIKILIAKKNPFETIPNPNDSTSAIIKAVSYFVCLFFFFQQHLHEHCLAVIPVRR